MKYRDAGVDIQAAREIKAEIKRVARRTLNEKVLWSIGAFGAGYELNDGPILVSSTDSVGTKILIARMINEHHSIGEDIVNHCVNDILCQGAEPLFFMDYIAGSSLVKGIVMELVEGVANACKKVGIPLVGGETAELPDVYQPGEYDLVGFIVGSVDKKRVVDGSQIKSGDTLIGLRSTGLHTNGYSLARKVVFELAGMSVYDRVEEVGTTVAQEFLKIHRCYHKTVQSLLKKIRLHAIVHITGGSFEENIPRVLPQGLRAIVDTKSWEPLPVFNWLRRVGEISWEEMYSTFNMGIGMILIVSPEDVAELKEELRRLDEDYSPIGRITEGARGVELIR